MLRLLSDEDFNGHVVDGVRRHYPEVDLVLPANSFAQKNAGTSTKNPLESGVGVVDNARIRGDASPGPQGGTVMLVKPTRPHLDSIQG